MKKNSEIVNGNFIAATQDLKQPRPLQRGWMITGLSGTGIQDVIRLFNFVVRSLGPAAAMLW
jgi:hypothetical protein